MLRLLPGREKSTDSRTDQSFTWGAGRGDCGEYSTIENSQVWISTIQRMMDHLLHSAPRMSEGEVEREFQKW